MLTRHSYSASPPRVEYRLTKKSEELVPIFQAMADWGMYLIEKNIQMDKSEEENKEA